MPSAAFKKKQNRTSCSCQAHYSIYIIHLRSILGLLYLHSFPTRRSSDLEGDRVHRHPQVLDHDALLGAAELGEGGAHRLALGQEHLAVREELLVARDRKSTRLNSSHMSISYAVCCF